MKKLLIRADDLGFSEAVNYGIEKTVKEGVIRSVGLMTNMPASQHGYDVIRDCGVCLGQHTNICVGKPVTDPALIPSITDKNGEFKSSKEYRSAKEDFVVLDEVVLEIEAQYRRFKEITGEEPHYFEGHAVASANFFKGLEIVASRHGLKYLEMKVDKPVRFGHSKLYMHMESMLPDYEPLNSVRNLSFHEGEDEADVFVCHPGYLDDYILKVSSLTIPRTKEVEMACSEELRNWIKENHISMLTYDEV